MNILILVNSFPPEIGSVAHLFHELGETLVERGHGVTVVTGYPQHYTDDDEVDGKYEDGFYMKEEMDGMEVIRVKEPSLPRKFPLIRGVEHFITATTSFIGGARSGDMDVILAYSPPLPLGLSAYLLGKVKRAPYIFNVQDIFPQSVIDLGLLESRFLIWVAEKMEQFIYDRASYISVHSTGNEEELLPKVDREEKLKVIPNWVDTDFIQPEEKMNGFREQHGLGDKFVVSFAGKMGFAQDMEVIIEAAEELESEEEILFLLVGEGVGKEDAVKKAEELGLSNVEFLPMQPKEVYAEILAASDISLAPLEEDVRTPVVPGKILSIMASGRPVVISMDTEGDAPRLVDDANCGLSVEAGDSSGLAEAIMELYRHPEKRQKMGENGRRYAEENLSRDACIDQYESLLSKASEES